MELGSFIKWSRNASQEITFEEKQEEMRDPKYPAVRVLWAEGEANGKP